jgi:dipeptidyl aminopeptidase/acylaminoacyl peptidase
MIKGFKHNLALASIATAVTVTAISMLACGESVQTTPVADISATRIVFSSDRDYAEREIYVMNADGSNLIRLTQKRDDDGWPAWSPDGAKIAFTSDRGTDYDEIWVMNSDDTTSPGLQGEGEL